MNILRFSRMVLMVILCLRNVTLAKAILRAGNSFYFSPLRSTPHRQKYGIICAFFTAMTINPFISFIHLLRG